jgi:peptidoglycan/LPS O-acetylase OafA/YrhL
VFFAICLLACLGASFYFAIGIAWKGRVFIDDTASPAGLWPAPTIAMLNVLFVGMVGLLIRYAGRPSLVALRMRWLVYLGEISYGLYLYHFIILKVVGQYADRAGIGRSTRVRVGELVLSILIAAASWMVIEKPILRLKDRFTYRPGITPDQISPPAGLELQTA